MAKIINLKLGMKHSNVTLTNAIKYILIEHVVLLYYMLTEIPFSWTIRSLARMLIKKTSALIIASKVPFNSTNLIQRSAYNTIRIDNTVPLNSSVYAYFGSWESYAEQRLQKIRTLYPFSLCIRPNLTQPSVERTPPNGFQRHSLYLREFPKQFVP